MKHKNNNKTRDLLYKRGKIHFILLTLIFNLSSLILKVANRYKNTIYLVLIFNLSSLILLTCSTPNDGEDKVTFSGTVTLEGEEDHSGVTVSLYEPVELDTALLRINREYPHIGVQISQETEFDHREHEPVYTTITNTDGSWKIDGVKEGEYNVVAEKEGWGWKIIENYKNGEIFLQKILKLEGNYSNLEIPSESFIEIVSDVVVENNGEIVVRPGTVVILRKEVQISGNFSIMGEAGSSVKILSFEEEQVGLKFDFLNGVNIDYAIFDNVINGIYIKNSKNVKISNCILKNAQIGYEFLATKNINIENTIFKNINSGIAANGSDALIQNSIFYDCAQVGIELINCDLITIMNCLFYDIKGWGINANPRGGTAYLLSNIHLYQSDFTNNYTHVYAGKKANVLANNNNFLDYRDFILDTNEQIGLDSLDFKKNYWGTSDIFEISKGIIDRNDRNGVGTEVNYSNFSFSYILWRESS